MTARIDSLLWKLIFLGVMSFLINALAIEPSQGQNNDIKTVDWNVLCAKFPLNSRCLEAPPEIIKIALKNYGAENEWIRIDKTGNKVRLLYTRQTSGGFVRKALDGIVDAAVPFPVPFSVYPKQWADRQTTKVVFQPDNCQLDSKEEEKVRELNCTILGKNSLILPKEINIRAGTFTLEYTEGKLTRTITFRIPANAKSEIGSIVVD